MFYFIPAWFSQGRWMEQEQAWYVRRMQSEMDDTVKQIQLFDRQKIMPYKILLLSHAPNFRHFLHRQSVFHAPYWSVFDAIQGFTHHKQKTISFLDMEWPQGIEFLYSNFAVIAMLNGERYALINFGEDGNMITIDRYQNGQLSKRNIFDDRGFISAVAVFEGGRETQKFFMDENGEWKICRNADGQVLINKKSCFYVIPANGEYKQLPFAKTAYNSMDELIAEVLAAYLSASAETDDIYCIAVHSLLAEMMARFMAGRKTILSVWNARPIPNDSAAMQKLLYRASAIVGDTHEELENLHSKYNLNKNKLVEITPFDSRVEFGISQQIKEQRILVPVDNITDELFTDIIINLAEYMRTNEKARIHLFTRNALYSRCDDLLQKTRNILKSHNLPEDWAIRKDTKSVKLASLLDEPEEEIPQLFFADQCIDELAVSKCLRTQRVMVDMAPTPDLFLQIGCITMGIPQIVHKKTNYVVPSANGRINSDINTLGSDLQFYLDGLGNWNAAVVASYEIAQNFTATQLVGKWKEVIERVGTNTDFTAWTK